MPRRLIATVEHFPLARQFRISRGAKTEAVVVTCEIVDGEARGRGECVPYARYGESIDSVREQIEAVRPRIEAGASREELGTSMPAGAARNAVDCALWDLAAKTERRPAAELAGIRQTRPLQTAFTIGLDEADEMARQAREAARPLLKLKLGTDDDVDRLYRIREAVPEARLIVDANEGWREDNIRRHMLAAADCGVLLVEQPLPDGEDAILSSMPHPVPVCADESSHTSDMLAALVGRYDYVNVKLDKTGGLTEALVMVSRAHELGFGVMVGCMVGSSLAMAPAVLAAQTAEFVDLDGPLLMAKDRADGLVYAGATVSPPTPSLWG